MKVLQSLPMIVCVATSAWSRAASTAAGRHLDGQIGTAGHRLASRRNRSVALGKLCICCPRRESGRDGSFRKQSSRLDQRLFGIIREPPQRAFPRSAGRLQSVSVHEECRVPRPGRSADLGSMRRIDRSRSVASLRSVSDTHRMPKKKWRGAIWQSTPQSEYGKSTTTTSPRFIACAFGSCQEWVGCGEVGHRVIDHCVTTSDGSVSLSSPRNRSNRSDHASRQFSTTSPGTQSKCGVLPVTRTRPCSKAVAAMIRSAS